MENDKKNQNEDEISLLDLFSVLLRYRVLVICITIISLILAITGYFFYPAYQYKNISKGNRYQAKVIFTVRHQAITFVNTSLEKLINDPELILESLKDAGMDTFQGSSLSDENMRSKVLFLLNKFIEDTNDKLKKNSSSNSNKLGLSYDNSIEFFFYGNDVDKLQKFIQSLFIRGNEKIVNYLRLDFEAIVYNFENIRDNPNDSQTVKQFLAENITQYTFLKDVLDGKDSILVQIGKPIITEDVNASLTGLKNSYKLKGIVVVFAGFFIAVFIAFLLNAVSNIKNDEEAMKKIHDALGNNDGK